MQNTQSKIASQNWESITESMHENGFAIIPNILNNEQCEDLKFDYDNPNLYRKTVVMERYRFGLGEYKYFNYPLPDLIQNIRTSIYPKLAPIANAWMKVLNINTSFAISCTYNIIASECHNNHS